jgi:hypothetical protein
VLHTHEFFRRGISAGRYQKSHRSVIFGILFVAGGLLSPEELYIRSSHREFSV